MEYIKKEEERRRRRNEQSKAYQRKLFSDPIKRGAALDKRRAYARSPVGRIANYKCQAKMKDREWSLTDEVATALFRSACHYCGLPPDPLNGIDRKDNDQGYYEDNCLACCSQCNYAKRNLSYADFWAWIDRIIKYKDSK